MINQSTEDESRDRYLEADDTTDIVGVRARVLFTSMSL